MAGLPSSTGCPGKMSIASSLQNETILSTSLPAEARSAHSASRRNNLACSITGSKACREQLTITKREPHRMDPRDIDKTVFTKSALELQAGIADKKTLSCWGRSQTSQLIGRGPRECYRKGRPPIWTQSF